MKYRIPVFSDVEMVFPTVDESTPWFPTWCEAADLLDSDESAFIGRWFFCGLTEKDMARLSPRDGVDGQAALRAIQNAMGSWALKHEHKQAGCAALLRDWFTLAPHEAPVQ